MSESINVEALFASKVFTLGKMKERLPKSIYKELVKVIDQGGELSLATADVVYFAKDWEKYRGCRIENTCAVEYGIELIIEDYRD